MPAKSKIISTMKKKLFNIPTLFTFVLFLLNTTVAFGQLSADTINTIIKKEVDNKRSVSIIVGMIDLNGKKIISYGKVNDNSNQLPDGNTIYEIGSITKVFTAILLADMVIKGQVHLDDPISKFLPKSVKFPVRNGKEITLLDLTTQTSGLPRMPDNFNPKDPENPFADYTVEQMYAFLSNYTLTRDIGSRYEYSNIGVGILGHILSLVAGTDYETLVKKRICEPLKMNSTVITLTSKLKENLATGHNESEKSVSNWDLPTLAGAGALRSTVNDMLIFTAANLGLIKSALDSAILLSHIIRDSTVYPDVDIAMGWHIFKKFGNPIIWHDGETGGYSTFIGLDENSKKGIVVLSNSVNAVGDIGLHILNTNYKIRPYLYKWFLKDTIGQIVNKRGIDAAIDTYHKLKIVKKQEYLFNEDQLNNVGYELLDSKKIKEAIAIFELNSEEYPKSWNVFDSLGEAYMDNGDTQLAINNYQKSIYLNPANTQGIKMIQKLKIK
jgi:D-alanyl-D-alanine-carboxypeptidase/D-alanyl-D-alanine-endopeptidase